MFQKHKRIVDQEVLQKYRGAKCVVCSQSSEPAHIRSRGASGDDIDDNILALCRKHHSESHNIGWAKFCLRYPKVYDELMKKGWIFNNNKLMRK